MNLKDMHAAMTTIAFAMRQIVQNARQITIVRDKKPKNVVMNQPFIKMGNVYQKLRAYLQQSLVQYLRQQRNHHRRVKEIVHFWSFYEFNFPGLSCLCISR